MRKKVTWNDLQSAKASDLMKHYKISERELQQHLHRHLGDAPLKEKEKVYADVYNKRR